MMFDPSLSDPERLAALRRYDVLGSPGEAAFDRISDLAALMLDAPMAGVHFLNARCQWAKNLFGFNNSFTRWPSNGLCWSDPLLNSPPNQGEMSIDRGGLLTQTIVMQTNDEIETAS
jgi:hypothetical protein